MRAIVGLGNPGSRYARTRHNVGFVIVDAVASEMGARWVSPDTSLELIEGELWGTDLLVAKPRTWMNRSGLAAGYLVERYGVVPADMVIVYDDWAIPLGKIRIRERGSAGGHNGVHSILEALGTDEVPRLRFGIGRPAGIDDDRDYVLSPFEESELPTVRTAVRLSLEALEMALREGMKKAMSIFNQAGD